MAEFSEVMRQIKRLCRAHGDAECGVTCPLSDDGFACSVAIDVPNDIEEKKLVEIERIVMDWAENNPEPRYPSWKEVWARLFPRMTEKLPPCPRYFVDRERYGKMCSGSQCDACLDRPIPADIAEKLGIKPIGENDDA